MRAFTTKRNFSKKVEANYKSLLRFGKGGHFRCFAYWTTSREADLQLNGLHGKFAKSPSKLQGKFK